MKGFGTDIVSLAAILGGAAVGGLATVALLSGAEPAQAACSVGALTAGPQIVVTRSEGSHAVVMASPRIRIHSLRDCVTAEVDVQDVTVHLEEALHEAHEVRIHMAEQRIQMREAVGMMVRVREAEASLEDTGAHLDEVRVILEKMEKGSGGQMD
jgi:hypothetical protein